MTKKQTLSFIALWFFTIGLFSLGFVWLIDFSDCTGRERAIDRVMDNQTTALFDFLFNKKGKGLSQLDLAAVEGLIEKKEEMIRMKVEHFKKSCRSRRNRATLVSILNQYRSYLYLKQKILNEKQDFTWLEDMAIPDRMKDDL